MKRLQWTTFGRQILDEYSDSQLLEQYGLNRSEEAFAVLMSRYRLLVWNLCRKYLANAADADDAFQATFLVLARSAKSIRTDAPLGPWLYGVAFRVCQNARRAKFRRSRRESASARPEANQPVADSKWESAYAAVVEEIQKLPDAQRTTFVLCEIEGRSESQAAAALGQKIGTISSRLARARSVLMSRLTKRGFGIGAIAVSTVASDAGGVSAALVDRTLSLQRFGEVIPISVQMLTRGVTGMAILNAKVIAAGLLVTAGLTLSVGSGWFASAVPSSAASKPTSGAAVVQAPPRNPGEGLQPPKGKQGNGPPGPLKPGEKDDELRKLKIEHHNLLDKAIQAFDDRLKGGVYRGAEEEGLHYYTLEKLEKARLDLEPDDESKLKALEQFHAYSLQLEKVFEARKDVDIPVLWPVAKAHRLEVETQIVVLKKMIEQQKSKK